jgi:glycosyltransferase involved in cell wall biosynthesis
VNVAVVTPWYSEGDAVGNDVFGMVRWLRRQGHTARLFTEGGSGPLPFAPIADAADFLGPDDLCVYHHSLGCEPALGLLRRLRCRRLVRYHNVTPAQFFEPGTLLHEACVRGAEQLPELADLGCEFAACSAFSAGDVARARPGTPCAVVPPFTHVDDLLRATPDYLAALPFHDAVRNVLLVGRVAPNKNVVAAVEALAVLNERHDGRARLVVVGDPGDLRYAVEVRAAAERLGVSGRVFFAGKVTLRQLKAFYLVADALLLPSGHEGFGVPLVEAFALRVPAVAADATALPETGGDAARYVDPGDPAGMAAALAEVLADPGLREDLMARGWTRYRERFTTRRVEETLGAVVERGGAAGKSASPPSFSRTD